MNSQSFWDNVMGMQLNEKLIQSREPLENDNISYDRT